MTHLEQHATSDAEGSCCLIESGTSSICPSEGPTRNMPFRLMRMTSSKSASVMSRKSAARTMPALFTRMSTPWNVCSVAATSASTCDMTHHELHGDLVLYMRYIDTRVESARCSSQFT